MELLTVLVACIATSIVCNAYFYNSSDVGEMDVKWNDEDCTWDAKLSLPAGVDYSKIKKIIIKVNHK